MDTSVNKLVEFDLNNTIHLRGISYPQNGYRIVTIDTATSLQPLYGHGIRTSLTLAVVFCTETRMLSRKSAVNTETLLIKAASAARRKELKLEERVGDLVLIENKWFHSARRQVASELARSPILPKTNVCRFVIGAYT